MNNPRISMIAAVSENRAIGKSNDLLWKIPEDMKYFKNTTKGHAIIMGAKTLLSMNSKPLPNRTNIVLTHHDLAIENVIVCNSVQDCLLKAKQIEAEEIFIIGGGNIYKQFLPLTDRLYITLVEGDFSQADTFFPDYSQFDKMVSQRVSQDDNYKYNFMVLER